MYKKTFFCALFVLLILYKQQSPAENTHEQLPENIDLDLVYVIQEAMNLNIEKMQRFEAEHIVEKVLPQTNFMNQKFNQSNNKIVHHYWQDGKKFRRNTEYSISHEKNGKIISLSNNECIVYDGEKYITQDERWNSASIKPNMNIDDSINLLNYCSYFAFLVDLHKNLGAADSIRFVKRKNENDFIEVKFKSGDLTACDLTVILDPNRGFCVVSAEIFLEDGTLAGIKKSNKIRQFKGCWVVVETNEETYRLSGLQQKKQIISTKEIIKTKITNWDAPVHSGVFSVDFAPETLVTDMINDKEYVVDDKDQGILEVTNKRLQKFCFIFFINLLFIIALLFKIFRKRSSYNK